MHTISKLLALASLTALTACAVETDDEPALGATEQEGFAYRPMGFARVSATGASIEVFNSAGAAVTPSRTSLGRYRVEFSALGTSATGHGAHGNVQVVAHGTANTRCINSNWAPGPTSVVVFVKCFDSTGALTDAPFAALFVRDAVWPSVPSTWPTGIAYTRVSSGTPTRTPGVGTWERDDFNSSGAINTWTRPSVGRAVVTVPNATSANASIMVTAHEDPLSSNAHTCSLVSWAGNQATVECRRPSGALVDAPFTFLYATSGPPRDQQGAHALFDGTAVDASKSAALGKISWCSPASVTGSRSGSLASILVAGDLGSWDTSPFVRASFAIPQGAAAGGGYCKIESLSTVGTAPDSRATTTVRCYSATGAVIAAPAFRFTHVTSDGTGPC